MTSPMNDNALLQELNWKETLDWLLLSLKLYECDPSDTEYQFGFEAAVREVCSVLTGRSPAETIH